MIRPFNTKKRLRQVNQPFAYCKAAIRILQTCYSHSFKFFSQAFFTPFRTPSEADFFKITNKTKDDKRQIPLSTFK